MLLQELLSLSLVFGIDVVVAGLVCCLYAVGLRLWEQSHPVTPDLSGDGAATAGAVASVAGAAAGVSGASSPNPLPLSAHLKPKRIAAVACFGLCCLVVVVALWFMIPALH